MNWAILVVAGILEVGWAIGLKYTHGFSGPGLLGIAMKTLPAGAAYGVWVGVGAAGTVVLGIVLLGESASLARMMSVAVIVAGIVGLKLSTPLDRYPRCLLGNSCCRKSSPHAARRSVSFCAAYTFTPMAQIKPNSSRPIAVTTFPFSLPRAVNFR